MSAGEEGETTVADGAEGGDRLEKMHLLAKVSETLPFTLTTMSALTRFLILIRIMKQ